MGRRAQGLAKKRCMFNGYLMVSKWFSIVRLYGFIICLNSINILMKYYDGVSIVLVKQCHKPPIWIDSLQ